MTVQETDNSTKDAFSGLKGILVCLIAFTLHYEHFENYGGLILARWLPFSFAHGPSYVEIFFMLSGFGCFLSHEGRIRRKELDFITYIRGKISKLYPPMIVTLFVVAFLQGTYYLKTHIFFIYEGFDIYHFLLNALGLQYGIFSLQYTFNGPAWFISILMILYILFFVTAYFSKGEKELSYIWAVLAMVGGIVYVLGWDYPVLNSGVARGVISFGVGVIMALASKLIEKWPSRWGNLCLVCILLLYLVYRKLGDPIFGNLQMVLILAVYPMMVYAILSLDWVRRILGSALLKMLGGISYFIFLWHFPAQLLLKNYEALLGKTLDYSSMGMWALYVAMTILLSMIYSLINKAVNKKQS